MELDSPNDLRIETPIVAELVRVARGDVPAGYVVEPHQHHFYQLDVILSGCFFVKIENRKPFPLRAGEALLIPPLTRHGYQSAQALKSIVFKLHLGARYWPVWGTKVRHAPLPRELMDILKDWMKQADGGAALVTQQCQALVTLCLVSLARHRPDIQSRDAEPDEFRRRLLPLLERIALEPYSQWSAGALAGETHMSPRHFSRRFRRLVGRNLKSHLLETRMRAAAEEVVATTAPALKDIGQRAGYATIHGFTHAFRKHFGVSPGAYRRQPARL